MRVAWLLVVVGCGFHSQATVGEDAGAIADAATTAPGDGSSDAATPIDLTQCPATYATLLTGQTSRYRLITDGHRAWEQSDACAGDLPGHTHLVVLETKGELTAVSALIDNSHLGISSNAVWVGAVQLATALTPDTSWLGFDDQPLIDAWDHGEPNDAGGTEIDHREQFARLDVGHNGLADSQGGESRGAVCECDGKPLAVLAATTIDLYRVP